MCSLHCPSGRLHAQYVHTILHPVSIPYIAVKEKDLLTEVLIYRMGIKQEHLVWVLSSYLLKSIPDVDQQFAATEFSIYKDLHSPGFAAIILVKLRVMKRASHIGEPSHLVAIIAHLKRKRTGRVNVKNRHLGGL